MVRPHCVPVMRTLVGAVLVVGPLLVDLLVVDIDQPGKGGSLNATEVRVKRTPQRPSHVDPRDPPRPKNNSRGG